MIFDMTPEQKILFVLNRIDSERKINHNDRFMIYKLNQRNQSTDVLMDDEEKRILAKLYSEGVIDIVDPNTSPSIPECPKEILEEYLYDTNRRGGSFGIEILNKFHFRLFILKLTQSKYNVWQITNPFWLIFIFLNFIKNTITKILKWCLRHKIITSLLTLLGLLAIDYGMAWKNIGSIFQFLNLEF